MPAAAVALLLRRTALEMPEALALDLASPLFWPIVRVDDVTAAIVAERARQSARYARVFEPAEAQQNAHEAVARSIGAILRLRPELTGHMAAALVRAGMRPVVLQEEKVFPLRCGDPETALFEAANSAAQRADRLPNGLGGLIPPSL